jgi:signal transduction histidine kinase
MALPTGSVRVGLGANPFLVTRFQDKTSLDPVLFMPFYAAVQQPDGGWLELRADRPLFGEIASRLALWLLATTAIIAPIAFVLARRLTRPISSFALGAERLGQDPRAPRLEVTGPAEVQSAVRAFNGMQDKLRSYVEHRVRLVAAIAHDLRTPLTRLKIQIEALPDEVRPRAEREITLMDAMIESTLAFVKDADTLQDRHRLHLLSLVESVADDLSDIGQDVDVEQGGDPVIEGDPLALRRLVTNLIDNAVKFGGKARCRVYVDGDTAVIQIDDDGPGIPDRDLERLFEPFVRGEESLYRETGGIGLGLSIVRTIAHAHGGVATLGNRLGGGLRAETRIPLAQT